jgi:hypothetical protein
MRDSTADQALSNIMREQRDRERRWAVENRRPVVAPVTLDRTLRTVARHTRLIVATEKPGETEGRNV